MTSLHRGRACPWGSLGTPRRPGPAQPAWLSSSLQARAALPKWGSLSVSSPLPHRPRLKRLPPSRSLGLSSDLEKESSRGPCLWLLRLLNALGPGSPGLAACPGPGVGGRVEGSGK